MSIENGYRPNPEKSDSQQKKEPKNSKNNLRKIIAGVVALGAAGYMALSGTDSAEPPVTKDKLTNPKPDSKPEPDFDPSRFVIRPQDTPVTESEPNTFEPLQLPRPKADDSVNFDTDQEIPFPPELQEQVNELHKLCDDFYTEDPWTLLDPLRPPIAQQISRNYRKLVDDAKEYSNVPHFNEESFCGNREKFFKRYENLANIVLGSDLSAATKRRLLHDLTVSDVGFYNGGFQATHEMSDFFVDKSKRPTKEDEYELNQKYLEYGLREGNNLSQEEYMHIAYRLYFAKTFEKSLFTPEEDKALTAFIAPYIHDNAFVNQSNLYNAWSTGMNKQPGSDSNEEEIQNWRTGIYADLSELIKAIEEGKQEDKLNIEPRDYGCPYSLEELKMMRDELDPDK